MCKRVFEEVLPARVYAEQVRAAIAAIQTPDTPTVPTVDEEPEALVLHQHGIRGLGKGHPKDRECVSRLERRKPARQGGAKVSGGESHCPKRYRPLHDRRIRQ